MRRHSPWAMSPNIQSFLFSPFAKQSESEIYSAPPACLLHHRYHQLFWQRRTYKKSGPEKQNKKSQWVTAVYRSGAQELDAGFVPFRWTLLLPLWKKKGGTVRELQLRQSCEAAHLSPASHRALEPGAEKVEGWKKTSKRAKWVPLWRRPRARTPFLRSLGVNKKLDRAGRQNVFLNVSLKALADVCNQGFWEVWRG